MKTKKLLLAFLAGAVVMTVLDVSWYQGIMKEWYPREFAAIIRPEEQVKMIWDVLGYYIGIFLMAFAYPFVSLKGKPVSNGLIFGLFMGVIMHLPVQFILYAHYTFPFTGVMGTIAFQIVEKTVGGVVIALVYGRSAS